MLSLNIEEIQKQIDEAKQVIKRKLIGMVKKTVQDIVFISVYNTPLGELNSKTEHIYLWRQRELGLEPTPGFAQGSWQARLNDSFSIQALYSGEAAIARSQSQLSSFKLGDNIYIGNSGYYIQRLETGWSKKAPAGIMQPSLQEIKQINATDFKRYFDSL